MNLLLQKMQEVSTAMMMLKKKNTKNCWPNQIKLSKNSHALKKTTQKCGENTKNCSRKERSQKNRQRYSTD